MAKYLRMLNIEKKLKGLHFQLVVKLLHLLSKIVPVDTDMKNPIRFCIFY